MPSLIFTRPALDPGADGKPTLQGQEDRLLDGMRTFGDHFDNVYDPDSSANSDVDSIVNAMDLTIAAGAAAYFHNGTEFVRVYHPSASGRNIMFKEAADGSGPNSANRIRVEKDAPNHMVVAAPIGDWQTYRDAFARQTAVDYIQNNMSTKFFAAAILISRCK